VNIKFTSLFLSGMLILLLAMAMASDHARADLDGLSFEQLETPTDAYDLVEVFSRLEFTMTQLEEGNVVREMSIEYQYEGTEEVEGQQADRISLRGSDIEPMEIWLAAGKIVQMEVEGEMLPPQMLDMASEQMLQGVFYPFYFFDDLDLEELDEMGNLETSRSAGTVGGLEADIIEVDIQDMEEMGLDDGVVRIGVFEDFLMLASYDIMIEGEQNRMEVDVLELR